jgi:hypothetical protein
MNFNKIYEVTHNLDAPLQPIEDGRPVREAEKQEQTAACTEKPENTKSPLSQAREKARNALSSNIVPNQIIEFTRENYDKELGGTQETPIGNVVMGKNVYKGGDFFSKMEAKTEGKDRRKDICQVKTTITTPSIIIKVQNYENRYIYGKAFDDTEDGGKEKQVFSVIVDNGTAISSYGEDHANIREFVYKNLTTAESLIYPK